MAEGMKHDGEKKFRPELLSPAATLGLSAVLTVGAKKYEDRNWEKGILYSRVYGALMRHMLAWWDGEDFDPETGLPHLDHAQCCIHFLSHYHHNDYCDIDDRPKDARKL